MGHFVLHFEARRLLFSSWLQDKYCFERFQSALRMVEAVLHRNLSLTSHHQADFTAAPEHAEESLRLEPQNVKSKYHRGLALWALDRSEEARTDLKARCLGVRKNANHQG